MQTDAREVLAGEAAIVTGGASGIGGAIARTLHDAGAAVAIVDVERSAAEQLARDLGERAIPIQADVSAPADVAHMVGETVAAFGRASILVHAAAPFERSGGLLAMDPDAWQRVVSVVLVGGYLAARAFAEQVIRQGGGGHIVNIISTAVERPRVNASAYVSAKSGLAGLTRVLALELGPHGINVNAVGPGLTRTPTVEARNSDAYNAAFLAQVPKGRIGLPQDVANAVLFLVSPGSAYLTGQLLYVDGGYTAGNLSVRG